MANMMKSFPQMRRNQGFSLVEIMVGVTIGLIGVVVIFQVLTSWDARRRSTTAGGDAQIAGTIAMFRLEQDLRQAGMGFGTADLTIMGCPVTASYSGTAIATPAFQLYPVQIIPGVAGAPDEVVTFYGNSSFLTDKQTFTASTSTTKKTQTRNGFQAGDVVVVAGNGTTAPASATCALVEVSSTTNADGYSFDHVNSSYTNFYTSAAVTPLFNPAGGTGTTFTTGFLYSLGPNPQRNDWQIQNGRILTSTDRLRNGAATEIAEGIINLQAEYGVDSNNDNLITDGSGTPATPDEWTTTTPTDWTKVRAIRVALLARSRQFERNPVTTTAPSWARGAFIMTNLDGSAQATSPANPADNWRNYRYRVYEKVIPLRNMIWGTAPVL